MENSGIRNNDARGSRIKTGGRSLLTAAVLCMAACLWGCGASREESTAEILADGVQAGTESREAGSVSSASSEGAEDAILEEPESVQDADGMNQGYCFEAGGVKISVDADMDELAVELGESKSVFTAPSCAGEGITYLYSFGSYEIETYPAEDGKNRIAYIVLKDDTVGTAEGIDLSMTRQDVLSIYGESSEEGENKITYEKNGTKLTFLFDGEDMVSIEYASGVMG